MSKAILLRLHSSSYLSRCPCLSCIVIDGPPPFAWPTGLGRLGGVYLVAAAEISVRYGRGFIRQIKIQTKKGERSANTHSPQHLKKREAPGTHTKRAQGTQQPQNPRLCCWVVDLLCLLGPSS